jgi:hypothetical protein
MHTPFVHVVYEKRETVVHVPDQTAGDSHEKHDVCEYAGTEPAGHKEHDVIDASRTYPFGHAKHATPLL